MTRKTKVIISIFGAAVLIILGTAAWLYATLNSPVGENNSECILLIDSDDDMDSVRVKLNANATGWAMLQQARPFNVRTGRYIIAPSSKLLSTYRRIRNRQQDPLNLTIPEVRLASQLPARLATRLMTDSATLAHAMNDKQLIDSLGFNANTLPAMIIPNTYQVWWDISARDLVIRMHSEWKRFWNEERRKKAEDMGLTPIQVSTLASIVDSETANNDEKPSVAGMYINRLRIGMPLQADPTVVFAVGDFSLRRILNKHLAVESPYNTYRHAGLPPGPIRTPSIAGIEAVLNYTHHNYLYMCAKEDFSGTHNFAATYNEHLANARRYTQALNRRGIK